MSKKRTGGIIAGAVIVGGLALGGLNTVKIDPGYIGDYIRCYSWWS